MTQVVLFPSVIVTVEPLAWSAFAALFLALCLGALVRLALKAEAATGTARSQLVTVTVAVATAGAFGIFYNLVLPSPIFENFRYIWTGPLFTFFFAVVVDYATELLAFALVLLVLIRLSFEPIIQDYRLGSTCSFCAHRWVRPAPGPPLPQGFLAFSILA